MSFRRCLDKLSKEGKKLGLCRIKSDNGGQNIQGLNSRTNNIETN